MTTYMFLCIFISFFWQCFMVRLCQTSFLVNSSSAALRLTRKSKLKTSNIFPRGTGFSGNFADTQRIKTNFTRSSKFIIDFRMLV